jgi:hypothetical protein
MRLELADLVGADNTCLVSTGVFLRKVIEEHERKLPYWRIIDACHPLVKN